MRTLHESRITRVRLPSPSLPAILTVIAWAMISAWLCAPAHAALFRKSPADRWVALPNGDVMHYTELGNPAKKTILFVHGFPTSARLYEGIMQEICGGSRPSYRCLAVSLIGFGKSSCPGDGRSVDASYEVDRLEEFIDALHLNDFAVVVHDWGGPVGTAAALRHSNRVSHLVFMNTFLEFGDPGENEVVFALQDLFGEYFEEDRLILELFPSFVALVMQELTERWLFLPARLAYREPYQDFRLGRCRAQAGINLFITANEPQNLAIYEEIASGLTTLWSGRPARFLWATEDPLFGPGAQLGQNSHDYMASLMPQAKTRLIRNANHFMQEDQPETIAKEIVDFVR